MKRKPVFVFIMLGIMSFSGLLSADTIILKGGSSITGKILAEKETQLVVDIGIEVLVIDRDKIISIKSDEVSEGPPSELDTEEIGPPEPEVVKHNLYSTGQFAKKTLEQCYDLVAEAVVKVSRPGGMGSGFFVTEDGYLITNYHVIEKETKITVTVFEEAEKGFEKKQFKKVRIVALNPFVDLALLKVEDLEGTKVKFVYLGDMSSVKVGESVFAVGNPLGLERTMSEGVISTVSRVVEGLVYVQTNADINPGNSGGPLFNMAGEVVGVTNMGYIFYGGLGFAIPVNYVKHFIENYEAFAYDKDNPNSGFRYIQPDRRRNKNKPDLQKITNN
jgi:serine protease Do